MCRYLKAELLTVRVSCGKEAWQVASAVMMEHSAETRDREERVHSGMSLESHWCTRGMLACYYRTKKHKIRYFCMRSFEQAVCYKHRCIACRISCVCMLYLHPLYLVGCFFVRVWGHRVLVTEQLVLSKGTTDTARFVEVFFRPMRSSGWFEMGK